MSKENKWKYKISTIVLSNFERRKQQEEREDVFLNEMGEEGWELTDREVLTPVDTKTMGIQHIRYIFKKAISLKN